MKQNMISGLDDFIEDNEIQLFEIDKESQKLKLRQCKMGDKNQHTLLFTELEKITTQLNLIDINYSVDMDGSILLHIE